MSAVEIFKCLLEGKNTGGYRYPGEMLSNYKWIEEEKVEVVDEIAILPNERLKDEQLFNTDQLEVFVLGSSNYKAKMLFELLKGMIPFSKTKPSNGTELLEAIRFAELHYTNGTVATLATYAELLAGTELTLADKSCLDTLLEFTDKRYKPIVKSLLSLYSTVITTADIKRLVKLGYTKKQLMLMNYELVSSTAHKHERAMYKYLMFMLEDDDLENQDELNAIRSILQSKTKLSRRISQGSCYSEAILNSDISKVAIEKLDKYDLLEFEALLQAGKYDKFDHDSEFILSKSYEQQMLIAENRLLTTTDIEYYVGKFKLSEKVCNRLQRSIKKGDIGTDIISKCSIDNDVLSYWIANVIVINSRYAVDMLKLLLEKAKDQHHTLELGNRWYNTYESMSFIKVNIDGCSDVECAEVYRLKEQLVWINLPGYYNDFVKNALLQFYDDELVHSREEWKEIARVLEWDSYDEKKRDQILLSKEEYEEKARKENEVVKQKAKQEFMNTVSNATGFRLRYCLKEDLVKEYPDVSRIAYDRYCNKECDKDSFEAMLKLYKYGVINQSELLKAVDVWCEGGAV